MSLRAAPLPDAAPARRQAEHAPRHAEHAPRRAARASKAESAELGMWLFIATEILFFGAIFFAYGVARMRWPAGFAAAARHTDVLLGTLDTAVLLTSSCVVALALAAAEHGLHRWVPRLLAATAALGVVFLALKGLEYRHDWEDGLLPGARFALASIAGAEQFFALYFFATGLHAVHLSIGIAVIAVFAWGTRRPCGWAHPRRLHAAALYWHFVDVVWIFLYPLLYLVQRHP